MTQSARRGSGPVLAVIPARGGSKGLPRKNLRELAGKPLVVHSIEHAQATSQIDEVVVSTDDDEIASVSLAAGADVIIRPPELAQDDTPTVPVLLHVLERYAGHRRPARVVTVQPTSPLRRPGDLAGAIAALDSSYDAVVSVCRVEHSPYKMFQLRDDCLLPLFAGTIPGMPRQRLPAVYRENGAVYVTWHDVLVGRRSIWGERTRPYIMDSISSVDIDTAYELSMAELLLKERMLPTGVE